MCAEKVFFTLRKDYLRLSKLTTKVVKALTKVQENLLEQVHLFIYSCLPHPLSSPGSDVEVDGDGTRPHVLIISFGDNSKQKGGGRRHPLLLPITNHLLMSKLHFYF